MSKSKEELEAIAKQLVDAMLMVHRELWPAFCNWNAPLIKDGIKRRVN